MEPRQRGGGVSNFIAEDKEREVRELLSRGRSWHLITEEVGVSKGAVARIAAEYDAANPLVCDICGRRFSRPTALTSHHKKHRSHNRPRRVEARRREADIKLPASAYCACGCGELTLFGHVTELTMLGKSRAEICAALEITRPHLKSLLANPPKVLVGHAMTGDRKTAKVLNAGATFDRRRASKLFRDAEYLKRKVPTSQLHVARRYLDKIPSLRHEAQALEVRAFERTILAAYSKPVDAAVQPTALLVRGSLNELSAQILREVRLAREREQRERRLQSQADRETLEFLRHRVGSNWYTDRTPRDMVLMGPGVTPKCRSSPGFDKGLNPGEWLDGLTQRTFYADATPDVDGLYERSIARKLLMSPDSRLQNLLDRAIDEPEQLTEEERGFLRQRFDQLAGVS